MDAFEFAAGHLQIARLFGAAGEQDGIVIAQQIFDGDVHADVGVGAELDAFGVHLFEAAVDEALLHLEIGDAVAEQAADAVGFFEDRHPVAGAAELLRGGQARGSGADHGDAFAGAVRRAARDGSSLRRRRGRRWLFSITLMVTGGSLMPSTQAASHGAGQMRPVNSGKLLVACRTRDGFLPAAVDRRDRSSRE